MLKEGALLKPLERKFQLVLALEHLDEVVFFEAWHDGDVAAPELVKVIDLPLVMEADRALRTLLLMVTTLFRGLRLAD